MRQSRGATAHKHAKRSRVTTPEAHSHRLVPRLHTIRRMTYRRTWRPPIPRSDAYSKQIYDERCSLPSQEKAPTSAVASKLSYAARSPRPMKRTAS
jgi:hypothetical protein